MVSEISWDSEDKEPIIDAAVTRSTVHNGQLVLLYKGRDRNDLKPYDGRICLHQHEAMQAIVGSYSSGGRDNTFTLTGRFTDNTFSSFEGRWIEPGWTAKFYF